MPEHGLYNPLLGVTEGGLCLSVFAFVRHVGADDVLVLAPAPHERWIRDWAPNLRLYGEDLLARQWSLLRLPAAYLREGEHPEAALRRVLAEQLGLSEWIVVSERLLSFYGESRRFPGKPHWDLAWAYEVKTPQEPAPGPWAAAWRFAARADLAPDGFGSAHGDLVDALVK